MHRTEAEANAALALRAAVARANAATERARESFEDSWHAAARATPAAMYDRDVRAQRFAMQREA